MRGKLRDKRPDFRQEHIKRELMDRRRPPKRDSRITIVHMQQLEEDYLLDDKEAQLVNAKKNKWCGHDGPVAGVPATGPS